MRVSLTSNKRVRVRRESELTPKLRSCRTRAGSRRRERTVLPSWTMRGRKEQRPLPWRRRGLRRGASWYLCFSLLNFEAWPESRVRESSARVRVLPRRATSCYRTCHNLLHVDEHSEKRYRHSSAFRSFQSIAASYLQQASRWRWRQQHGTLSKLIVGTRRDYWS